MKSSCDKNHPPRFLKWILKRITADSDYRMIVGDCDEEFREIAASQGFGFAGLWYLNQVLLSSIPLVKHSFIGNISMLKSYLKTSYRNMKKQKSHTIINISGLAIGVACSILIILWYQYEYNFDTFHDNRNDIYQVQINDLKKVNTRIHPWTPFPLATDLERQFPEVINSVRIWYNDHYVRYIDKIFYEPEISFVDRSYFTVFSFPVIEGDLKDLMPDLNSIVISDNIKLKYFGDEDPIGKVLTFDNRIDFLVTGVIDVPDNSSLQGQFFLPIESLIEFGIPFNEMLSNWDSKEVHTFIHLAHNVNSNDFEEKIRLLLQQNSAEQDELNLQCLSSIHLYNPNGTSDILRKFNLAAATIIFIIIIACINFINLTTSRAEKRAKEVGLRKTVGARKHQLIQQFYTESALILILAFIVGIILLQLFLPVFNSITGKDLSFFVEKPFMIMGLISSVLLVCFLSGIYPSLFLSRIKPVKAFNGLSGTGNSSGTLIRRILVIIQFTFSILLIVSSVIVTLQLKFVSNMKLGFSKDRVFYIRMDGGSGENWKTIKRELLKDQEIVSVSAATSIPPYITFSGNQDWEGRQPDNRTRFAWTNADIDYAKTLGLKIIMGRDFSQEFINDQQNFLLNEEAVRQMELKDPIGKEFIFWGSNKGKIVGVVEDFHFHNLKNKIEPLAILSSENWDKKYLIIKYRSNDPSRAIDYVEEKWNVLNPGFPFNYSFLDKEFESTFINEMKFGQILLIFTLIAITISCMGLFGLTSHLVEKRTREIGIRKVLGASFTAIVSSLINEIIIWVLLSSMIALPLGTFIMNIWLQDFAYKTEISWVYFALTVIIALILAVFTVSYQTVKCAFSDPVVSIKHE